MQRTDLAIGLSSTYQEPYPTQVQGESQYRKSFDKLFPYAGIDEEGADDDSLVAALYLEDDNRFDLGNAVRVEIDDLVVGYLSRLDAKRYRVRLKELHAPAAAIGICMASVKGGFLKKDDTQADFGVRLDFSPDEFVLKPVSWKDEPSQTATPKSGTTSSAAVMAKAPAIGTVGSSASHSNKILGTVVIASVISIILACAAMSAIFGWSALNP